MNTADDRNKAEELLEDNGVNFCNILDTTEQANTAMMKYETLGGVTAVPMTYIIDPGGKVIDAWYGYDEKRSKVAMEKIKLAEVE